ncbi:MAG: YdcF family protein [Candidatus Rokuibacteriota bacterium]
MNLFRRGRATLILGLAGLLICLLLALGIRRAGSYLLVVDRLEPSDAIFVLAGTGPTRLVEAATLYHRGLAPLVVVSLPPDTSRAARELAGEPGPQERALRALTHAGVPGQAVARLNRVVENTDEELAVDFDYARAQGYRRVILVTSPQHTRRVRMIWDAYYQARLSALVHPTSFEDFDAARWWSSSRSLEKVFYEFAAIAHFWLGRPLPTHDRPFRARRAQELVGAAGFEPASP